MAHTILECIQLYFEAQACKTSLISYCVVCFNGRFGWVPFTDSMHHIASLAENEDEDNVFDESLLYLDYDNIRYSTCCVSVDVPFQFSDAGLTTLLYKVASLPQLSKGREFHLRLGTSLEQLTIEEIYKLVLICGPKTDLQINLSDEILEKMFKKSPPYDRTLKDVDYTSLSETVTSKLFLACIEDNQAEIVDYMLRKNISLINVPVGKLNLY